jgi:cation diffusion facilitator CzcD-associated flavoprotein CzcO
VSRSTDHVYTGILIIIQDNIFPVRLAFIFLIRRLNSSFWLQGASSDVGIHFYSLSTDLDPEWSSTHGSQADTQAYWRKLSHKYNIYRHIVFDHLVVSTEWSNQEQLYHITAEDVSSGVKTFTTAKIIISALGILEVPHIPKIAGLPSFKGETFHSARWDTGVDLRGKRVAVIGNGATAYVFR